MSNAGWTTATVAEIAAPNSRSIAIGPFGSSLKAETYSQFGIPVVRGQDISNTREISSDDRVFVPEEIAARFPACMVSSGDLVFPHRGAIGRVGMIGDQEMLLSTSMMKLTVNTKIVDPMFVFYYFRGPGRGELLAHASTVGTPGIGQPLRSLRGILIAFPDRKQQESIGRTLGALDDKIDANNAVAATAYEIARLRYQSATRSVEYSPMSAVLDPILGGTPSRTDEAAWDGSVPWISIKDITDARHGVLVSTGEGISESAAATKRLRALPIGSVVLTARGTVGKVALLAIAASINQSCYGFVPNHIPSCSLLFVVEDAARQARLMAHGSVFDTITMQTFDHVRIPHLTTESWAKVESFLAPLLNVCRHAAVEDMKLTRARDELLPLLMSGKIRVRDAERQAEDVL